MEHEKKASKYQRCTSMQSVSTHAYSHKADSAINSADRGSITAKNYLARVQFTSPLVHAMHLSASSLFMSLYKITQIISMNNSASNDTNSLHSQKNDNKKTLLLLS